MPMFTSRRDTTMHELFAQVLDWRDLSKAGDLFSLSDKEIENDLSEVLHKMQSITDAAQYLDNDNNQSVVEICITRVTSAIRETGTIEKHIGALVLLLQSCLQHDLKPTSRDGDPPHAKIASDVMSCVFLHYQSKPVMDLALPVAARFLEQGNSDLIRNLSSYLSLAAINNAKLLSQHIEPILNSVIGGNKALARVVPQIYVENPAVINLRMSELVGLLKTADRAERTSLLQLFCLVAQQKPHLLESHVAQFSGLLSSTATSAMVLQAFVSMATVNADPFVSQVVVLAETAAQQPATLCLVASIIGSVGRIDEENAKRSVSFLVGRLGGADQHTLLVLLREVRGVCAGRALVLSPHIADISLHAQGGSVAARTAAQQLRELCAKSIYSAPDQRTTASQTEGIVTVITLGGDDARYPPEGVGRGVVTPVGSRNASTSTDELCFRTSRDRVDPSRHSNVAAPSNATRFHSSSSVALSGHKSVPMRSGVNRHKGHSDSHLRGVSTISSSSQLHAIPFRDPVQQFCEKHLSKVKEFITGANTRLPIPIKATIDVSHSKNQCRLHFICLGQSDNCLYRQTFFTAKTKHPKTWIHIMFLAIQARSERAVSQHDASVGNLKACWDGLKIGSDNSFVRLVTSSFPSIKDMDMLLLELQSIRYFDIFSVSREGGGGGGGLPPRPPACQWICFLCCHPERATSLLTDGWPAIEGHLKEKKGRWKFFKRWKTRYFTLSGATISYAKKDSRKKSLLPIATIESIRAVGGGGTQRQGGGAGGRGGGRRAERNIPRAFEIFTSDRQTYVLKAKDGQHAEQWLQCLQIAVARSHKAEGEGGIGWG